MPLAPIIVSAVFDTEDFQWLDGLRRTHFPAERNHIGAHLTLFHHLPPSVEGELKQRLATLTRRGAPRATATGLLNLGKGVAVRIESPDLSEIRDELADAFSPLLIPQDAARWRPHVTIQNKVQPSIARKLYEGLGATFAPKAVKIRGLAAWWYRDGPWELLASFSFR